MLAKALTAKAIQMCAAGTAAALTPTANYEISVHSGPALVRQPDNAADAEATVRDLIARGADFDAGPLAINVQDFDRFGVTPASLWDACALARASADAGGPSLASVVELVRSAFGARITDTARPMNAKYGAEHSWHKYGQAVDFVPLAGLHSIDRAQIRAVMAANGIRLVELLGPGDPGHSNHWHIAFARADQPASERVPGEGNEAWNVTIAASDAVPIAPASLTVSPSSASSPQSAVTPAAHPAILAQKAPPQCDVFAVAEWKQRQGDGS